VDIVYTCPEARGQGIGEMMTRDPLLDAHSLGYRYGVLYASPAGARVYRRIGFTDHSVCDVYLSPDELTLEGSQ
jgi:predicted GNAT family acetyltransferase